QLYGRWVVYRQLSLRLDHWPFHRGPGIGGHVYSGTVQYRIGRGKGDDQRGKIRSDFERRKEKDSAIRWYVPMTPDSEKLKLIRNLLGLTQQEMADGLGVLW